MEKNKCCNERLLLLGLDRAAEGIELDVPGTLLNSLRLLYYCSCLLLCHQLENESFNGVRLSIQSGGRKCFHGAVIHYSFAEYYFYSNLYVQGFQPKTKRSPHLPFPVFMLENK